MDDDKIDLTIFLKEYQNDAKSGFQKANTTLLSLEKDYSRTDLLDAVSRALHTLKSSSAMIEFTDIAGLAHASEDLVGNMKNGAIPITQSAVDLLFEIIDTLEQMVKWRVEKRPAESEEAGLGLTKKIEAILTAPACAAYSPDNKGGLKAGARSVKSVIEKIEAIRVHTGLLDAMFNQVGELMIYKNRIDTLLSGKADKELNDTLSAMGRMITALQENVSQARLVPADEIFQKFPRMLRDMSKESKKDVEFIIEGREIELDKAVLDAITEPLMHLLRNAVDHGVELPDERQRQNKDRRGTIRLIAKRSENHIMIDVEDDGRGVDIAATKELAVRKGFIKQEDAGTIQDREVVNLLFSPGFSSAEQVTELSGRGIGLHVVKTAAREMGGTVEVVTEKGRGTKISLTLPLTTAVIQTLMVEEAGDVYAIPSDIVIETQKVKKDDIKAIEHDETLFYEGKVIPFARLARILNVPHEQAGEPVAVIIQRGSRLMAIGVDEVIGQIENIVKPFDSIGRAFKGFSGGIILGDGRVALLLDMITLLGFEALKEERYTV